MDPNFACKMCKNLIRSNQSSRSLCGMLIIPVRKGCEMTDLNGPVKEQVHAHYECYAYDHLQMHETMTGTFKKNLAFLPYMHTL